MLYTTPSLLHCAHHSLLYSLWTVRIYFYCRKTIKNLIGLTWSLLTESSSLQPRLKVRLYLPICVSLLSTYVRICICLCMYLIICMYVCMLYKDTYVCTEIMLMYVCTLLSWVCVLYTYIYIHTYIHMYVRICNDMHSYVHHRLDDIICDCYCNVTGRLSLMFSLTEECLQWIAVLQGAMASFKVQYMCACVPTYVRTCVDRCTVCAYVNYMCMYVYMYIFKILHVCMYVRMYVTHTFCIKHTV